MFKIHTKANRLMSANVFSVAGENILTDDAILPRSIDAEGGYSPHNVRLWVIGGAYGVTCAVFASNEQDALDSAVDANMTGCFMVSEEDTKAYYEACNENGEHSEGINYTALGNAGELHDLSDVWMAEADIQAGRDIELIIKIVRAQEQGLGNLDF